jgi:hypothetical protein
MAAIHLAQRAAMHAVRSLLHVMRHRIARRNAPHQPATRTITGPPPSAQRYPVRPGLPAVPPAYRPGIPDDTERSAHQRLRRILGEPQ